MYSNIRKWVHNFLLTCKHILFIDGLRLHRSTEAAMEEMSNMFRSIFPLIPEQTHYFWKTNQLGSTTVQRTSEYNSPPMKLFVELLER